MQPLKCLCGSAKCRGFIGGKEVANRAEDPRYDAVLLLVLFCMLCTRIKLWLCLETFHAFGVLIVLLGIECVQVQRFMAIIACMYVHCVFDPLTRFQPKLL